MGTRYSLGSDDTASQAFWDANSGANRQNVLASLRAQGLDVIQKFTKATRAATVPVLAGQLGVETDTGRLFWSKSTSAGDWSYVAPVSYLPIEVIPPNTSPSDTTMYTGIVIPDAFYLLHARVTYNPVTNGEAITAIRLYQGDSEITASFTQIADNVLEFTITPAAYSAGSLFNVYVDSTLSGGSGEMVTGLWLHLWGAWNQTPVLW